MECQFCGVAFTVQVQPVYSGFPQTVGGAPFPIPGMPGQIGGPPMAPGPMDAPPFGAGPDDGGNPFADDAGDDPGAADGQDAPPFGDAEAPAPQDSGEAGPPPPKGKSKKKSAALYRTASGAALSEAAFAEYLAVRHADVIERAALLERLRLSRVR